MSFDFFLYSYFCINAKIIDLLMSQAEVGMVLIKWLLVNLNECGLKVSAFLYLEKRTTPLQILDPPSDWVILTKSTELCTMI